MTTRILALAGLFLLAAVPPALCVALGALKIEHPWARPTAEGMTAAAAYLTVENTGSEPDTLLSASTPIAAKAQLHETVTENGVMHMRPVAGGITIAPGTTFAFRPGSYHIMLLNLKHKLDQGEHFPLTLTFAKAGTIELDVPVEGPAGHSGAMAQDHGMPGMDHGSH